MISGTKCSSDRVPDLSTFLILDYLLCSEEPAQGTQSPLLGMCNLRNKTNGWIATSIPLIIKHQIICFLNLKSKMMVYKLFLFIFHFYDIHKLNFIVPCLWSTFFHLFSDAKIILTSQSGWMRRGSWGFSCPATALTLTN